MRKIIAASVLALLAFALCPYASADSDPYQVSISTIGASGAVIVSTVNVQAHPLKFFALQVKGVGAAASAWDVRLDGSLDGTNYTPMVWHGTNDSDGTIKGSTNSFTSPVSWVRVRIAGVTLGSATGLTVKALATDR